MAERIFVYWSEKDKTYVAGAQSAFQYRTHLRQNVCPDFGLVSDVHDAHKHVRLDRANRRVTNAAQTGIRNPTFNEVPFGESVLGGHPEIITAEPSKNTRNRP
jgi:hypothetical protein